MLDYKKEMNESKEPFFEFYTKRMKSLEVNLDIPEELAEELQKKRDFGFKKYKEFSFQGSFDNAITSPTEEHLREELIDAINYAMHSVYKKVLYMQDDREQTKFVEDLVKLYNRSFDVFEAPE